MDVYEIPGFTEPVSSLSHLAGAGLFFVLGVFLVRRGRGSWARVLSLSVLVFSAVFLLSMSGTYHLLDQHAGREVMRRLDHAAIFVLIAGTFTPCHAILFRGFLRWGALALIWIAAINGIVFKMIFFRDIPEWLGLSFYLSLGWLGLISGTLVIRRYGFRFVKPLLFGALAYTAGALLEFLRWPVLIEGVLGPHELFHLAVLAGLGWHWAFVASFADGKLPPARVSRLSAPTPGG